MRNKTYNLMGTAAMGLLILSQLAFGQMEAEVHQVDIVHDEQGWDIEPCPLPGVPGDTWRIRNSASDTVCVKILRIVREKNPPLYIYTLAPADSIDHPIDQWDGAIAAFLGACPSFDFLTMCERPYGPTLTQWGIIALVMLLIGTTVFILTKRKEQTT